MREERQKIVIGLVGEMSSGKGTVARYIAEKYGASIYRFSTILRDILDRVYVKHARENIQRLSTFLRQTYGENLLSKVIYYDVKKDPASIIVVDGVRRRSDVSYLKEMSGFALAYIDASLETRYRRISERDENVDDQTMTLNSFKKQQEDESESQIRTLKSEANFIIDNNGTQEQLLTAVDRMIADIRNDDN
ncbi:MAG TPA: AAA family ATPase [Patescibacteria group bacterium]|nr:AAA family ATPase [Patescibacteria group bacterium]